ncbi:protein translocase subunit SecD [Candidatus Daviesbacteria bacterium]|nr:protein translocase subunit SecD [Candidatus Daviesbacteria bacterium]
MRIRIWLIFILIILASFAISPGINLSQSFKVPFLNKEIDSLAGNFPIKLGLDLQGGAQLVLETKMDQIPAGDREAALESAKEIIERRVNLFGVSEAIVQTSKIGETRRILVDLPGIKDASDAANLVGKTAQLEFRELAAEASQSGTIDIPTGLTGADLKRAQVVFSQGGGDTGPQVSIEFNPEGATKFAEITKRNIGKPLAIFLDNQFISAPTVQQEIVGGNAVISGNFSTDEAKALSIQLNAGALPVPIEIIEQRLIGPSLGAESVKASIIAGVIGLLTVILYMAFYYRVLGIIADVALVIYTVFVLAIFQTGLFLIPPVTLTLPGIAGFILSIGMAVDANILIFERMKEEIRWGRSRKLALDFGFNRAWVSIRDSNISSLITAGILYSMGTGLIKGFAITLAIGVLVSMFTAIFVTKTILKLFIK